MAILTTHNLSYFMKKNSLLQILVDEQVVNFTSCTWKSEKYYISNNEKVRVQELVDNFEAQSICDKRTKDNKDIQISDLPKVTEERSSKHKQSCTANSIQLETEVERAFKDTLAEQRFDPSNPIVNINIEWQKSLQPTNPRIYSSHGVKC